MSVRSKAWVTHTVISFTLLTIIATWAFEVVRSDRTGLGEIVAFIGIALSIGHVILATGAVAAWGRRPLGVIGIHIACLGLTTLFVYTTLMR